MAGAPSSEVDMGAILLPTYVVEQLGGGRTFWANLAGQKMQL